MEKKTDLRVIKTRNSIKKAFKELICIKAPSEITVKEISERAMIHRKTFYLHYPSIDALYEDIVQDLSVEFDKSMSRIPANAQLSEVTNAFFEHMSKQDPYVEKMICAPEYASMFEDLVIKIYKDKQVEADSRYAPGERDVITSYMCLVPICLYRRWVEGGKSISLGRLIELTGNLMVNGASSVSDKC